MRKRESQTRLLTLGIEEAGSAIGADGYRGGRVAAWEALRRSRYSDALMAWPWPPAKDFAGDVVGRSHDRDGGGAPFGRGCLFPQSREDEQDEGEGSMGLRYQNRTNDSDFRRIGWGVVGSSKRGAWVVKWPGWKFSRFLTTCGVLGA